MNKRPLVGIGILVVKGSKVLLGKRKGSHGAGEYGGPGGHLEFGESFEECAKRECLEEAGIKIKDLKFICLANIKKYGQTHYVDIGVMAKWESGKPKLCEPDKCEGWDWYDLDNPPTPLFEPEKLYFKALKNMKNFFDS